MKNPVRLLRPRALLALGAAVLVSGCATKLTQPISGYTCCNLRSEYDWVSRTNIQYGPMVPAGTPVRIEQATGKRYFYGYLAGTYVGFRDDIARNREEGLAWLQTIVVPQNPQQKLSPWAPEIQAAVLTSKLMVGMTREQVLMAVSYPSPQDTPDLKGAVWRYWAVGEDEDEAVDVKFGADGRVTELSGSPAGVRLFEYRR